MEGLELWHFGYPYQNGATRWTSDAPACTSIEYTSSEKDAMKRRIVKVEVDFLSLVPRGANQLRTLYKSDTGRFEIETLTKLDAEQGVLYAIAYAPEFRDSQGDIASVDVCKQMAYSFAANGAKLDLRHDGKAITKDRAFVAETFIVQKGDPRFTGLASASGTSVDPTGGWGVAIKLEDPELRKWYASGAWGGVSLGGRAHVVETNKEGAFDMDAKELLATLEKNNESLVTAIAKALTPPEPKKTEPKPADVKKTDPLAFVGNPLDPKDVETHLKKVQAAKLLKEVDWTDPVAVAKDRKSVV